MLDALMFGHERIKELCAFQEEIIAKVGKEKMEVVLYDIDPAVKEYVNENGKARLEAAVSIKDKLESYAAIDNATNEMKDHFLNDESLSEKERERLAKHAGEYCEHIVAEEVRRLISEEKIRPDGRKLDELRPLDSQVDLLPRVHGSAMFTRGQTQVLSVTTLGALGDNQIIDDLTEVEEKTFMHHYNFPPYSVGEVGRMGNPGRREIGHGALGERALKQVLPSQEEFPYAIRTVAEVLESNGSSSQASICAGTMSLMAAGVPIKAMVAGVAMGLITTGDNYSILTDIQGMEDHYGDMDFKLAGTRHGITGVQLDLKIQGLPIDIAKQAIMQNKNARMQILDIMEAVINAPRSEMKANAPKIHNMNINPDKIGALIGPGGKNIKRITELTGAQIDINEDNSGNLTVFAHDKEALDCAIREIELICCDIEEGQVYRGKVVSIKEFGVFVECLPGKEGLVHVSELADFKVGDPADICKIGDEIIVKCIGVDDKGRVRLSRRAVICDAKGVPYEPTSSKPSGGGMRRDGRRGGGREGRGESRSWGRH